METKKKKHSHIAPELASAIDAIRKDVGEDEEVSSDDDKVKFVNKCKILVLLNCSVPTFKDANGATPIAYAFSMLSLVIFAKCCR